MDHQHEFTRVRSGPPKVYFCAVEGCKAEVPVDPKTGGPGVAVSARKPVVDVPEPVNPAARFKR